MHAAKETAKWFIYNVLVSITLPLGVIKCFSLLSKPPKELDGIMNSFIFCLNSGVFVFLGCTLLIGILYSFKSSGKVILYDWEYLIIYAIIFISSILFVNSINNLIPNSKTLADNIMANFICLVASIIVSILLQFKLSLSQNYRK